MTDMQHPEKLRAIAATQIGLAARGYLLAAARAYATVLNRATMLEATARYWQKRAKSAEALLPAITRRELATMDDGPPPPALPPAIEPGTEETPHHGRAI